MNGAAPLSSSSSQAPTATASGTSSFSASASASSVTTEQAQKTDDKNGTGAIYPSSGGILLASIVVAVTAGWVVL